MQLSWLSGRALASQARYPGFDSKQLLAFLLLLFHLYVLLVVIYHTYNTEVILAKY